jgi:hypothetical protein
LPAILTGCAYDWAIGAAGRDAGSGGRDAGAGGSDTGAGGHPGTGGSDAGAGGSDAGPDCAALLEDLAAARTAAKTCTLGAAGQCSTSIVDECGCASYVTQGGSAAASAFAAAVEKVKAAGCAVSCSTCLLSPGACLLNGGTQALCVP